MQHIFMKEMKVKFQMILITKEIENAIIFHSYKFKFNTIFLIQERLQRFIPYHQ